MSDLNFKVSMDFAYGEPRTLSPGVQRIVANNPSVLTFKGTNTYIIGQGEDIAVIDPGPEDDNHFAAIMAAVGARRVTHILITHTHRDHVDGAKRLVQATDAAICGYGRGARSSSPVSGETDDNVFTPAIKLDDGGRVSGSDWALTAVFTPGHAPDHLCFQLDNTGVLFSGDHVMGWNTSVIAPPEGHMGDYLASLEKLLDRADSVYYPGHGGQIEKPKRFTKAYLLHRKVREQAILNAIRKGCCSIADVVSQVYKGLDVRLVKAASLSVQAHVEHLSSQGLIETEQPLTTTSRINAAHSAPGLK